MATLRYGKVSAGVSMWCVLAVLAGALISDCVSTENPFISFSGAYAGCHLLRLCRQEEGV
jgi:hypothetical protein